MDAFKFRTEIDMCYYTHCAIERLYRNYVFIIVLLNLLLQVLLKFFFCRKEQIEISV